jgi:hypothetical protein
MTGIVFGNRRQLTESRMQFYIGYAYVSPSPTSTELICKLTTLKSTGISHGIKVAEA